MTTNTDHDVISEDDGSDGALFEEFRKRLQLAELANTAVRDWRSAGHLKAARLGELLENAGGLTAQEHQHLETCHTCQRILNDSCPRTPGTSTEDHHELQASRPDEPSALPNAAITNSLPELVITFLGQLHTALRQLGLSLDLTPFSLALGTRGPKTVLPAPTASPILVHRMRHSRGSLLVSFDVENSEVVFLDETLGGTAPLVTSLPRLGLAAQIAEGEIRLSLLEVRRYLETY